MKKRTYRRISLKQVSVENVMEKLAGHRRLVFAVDVAKADMVAALADPAAELEQRVLLTVSWKHPDDHATLVELLGGLSRAGVETEAVMEPSGTYGDALRHQLQQLGIEVYRVSTHRTSGAAEVYDGVASLHDAKAAHILAKLHLDGVSRVWKQPSEQERVVGAAIAMMDLYRGERQRELGRLEGLLARHWPELLTVMELGSVTQLALLSSVGGPEQVLAYADAAEDLLLKVGQGFVKPSKVRVIVEAAAHSVGVPLCQAELEMLQALCTRALSTLRALQQAQRKVRALSKGTDCAHLAHAVGQTTAAVLVHDIGHPTQFGSSRAYLKAYGLNLREKSSGKHKGQLKLTKRGPGRARRYLWLAALRLLMSDPIARTYYANKVRRDGGKKTRAVIALMRKLAKGLYAIGKSGEQLDTHKLFDAARLGLAPS